MHISTTLHLQITVEGSTHSATLTQENGQQIIAKITIPQALHTLVEQLLESMRGTTVNKATPGLPVNIQILESDTITLLHKHLFENAIGEAIKQQLAAMGEKQELILVVSSPEAEIRNLPWEAVVGLAGLNDSRIGIVRTILPSWAAFHKATAFPPTGAPLKLLFVTALPENIDERHKQLQIEDEQRKLIEAVGNLEATGNRQPKMVIEFLDVASLAEITQALQARQHDILHVSGHGKFQEDVKRGILYLENEDGDLSETDGAAFAEAIRAMPGLRLVVLSACETAVAGPDGGTAEAIALAGIPAVLGMRFSVEDLAAKMFTTEFYQELANGETITSAVAAGRKQLWKLHQQKIQAIQNSHNSANSALLGEWFTPVLYLNGAVGALVDPALPYLFPRDFYPAHATEAGKSKRLIGSGFIGRKRQLIRMRKAFREGKHVCLVGMGGIGKTTLAEAFAGSYENGSHRVIFLQGKVGISQMWIMGALLNVYREAGFAELEALKLKTFIEDGKIPIANRLAYLFKHLPDGLKIILILDNFDDLQILGEEGIERIIQDPELSRFIGLWLGNTPRHCHLILTTRYRIAGLTEPKRIEEIDLGKLSFAEQYRIMNYSAVLRQFTSEERKGIFERLDGLPRAYEYLEVLAAQELFDFAKLSATLGDVTGQIFENLMLRQMFNLLNEKTKRVFLVASVFFTRTPINALVYVLNGELSESSLHDCLIALANWGLCFWDIEIGEFEIHRITCAWITSQKKLGQTKRKEIAMKAGNYFSDQPNDREKLISIEYYEIAKAWEPYGNTILPLQHHYQLIGNYDLALHLCKRILKNVPLDNLKGRALTSIGNIFNRQGKYGEALKRLQKGIKIQTTVGDRDGLGTTFNSIGLIYLKIGKSKIALKMLEKSLTLKIETKNQKGEAITRNNIAQVHIELGNQEIASKYYQESIEIQNEIKDWNGLSTTLNNLGQLLYHKGDVDRGLSLMQESLELCTVTLHRASEGTRLHNIGNVYFDRGEFKAAMDYCLRSLKIREEIGDRRGQGLNLNQLGRIAKATGNYVLSISYYESSLQIFNEIGSKRDIGVALNNIGQYHMQMNENQIALDFLDQSLSIWKELNDKFGQGATLKNIGGIYDTQGDTAKAIEYYLQSLGIQESIQNAYGIAVTSGHLGIAYFKLERFEEAVPLLFRSYRISLKIKSSEDGNVNDYLTAIQSKLGESRYQEILSTIDLEDI